MFIVGMVMQKSLSETWRLTLAPSGSQSTTAPKKYTVAPYTVQLKSQTRELSLLLPLSQLLNSKERERESLKVIQ